MNEKVKQIEETADDIYTNAPCLLYDYDDAKQLAGWMYKEGYRKQREGKVIETIKNGRSNRVFDCCGEDFTKLTSWIMPKYCPNCGAKMK